MIIIDELFRLIGSKGSLSLIVCPVTGIARCGCFCNRILGSLRQIQNLEGFVCLQRNRNLIRRIDRCFCGGSGA